MAEIIRENRFVKNAIKKTRAGKIDLEKLAKSVKEKPGGYLKERALEFGCTKQAVHYALKQLKISNKKNIYIP